MRLHSAFPVVVRTGPSYVNDFLFFKSFIFIVFDAGFMDKAIQVNKIAAKFQFFPGLSYLAILVFYTVKNRKVRNETQ